MANCAAAIVLDSRTAKFTDVKIFTKGFATSFNVADSTYQYDNSPLVRAERVAMPDTTRWLAYCAVSYPSKEPTALSRETNSQLSTLSSQQSSTRSRQDTDLPFSCADSGQDLWQYECYVTLSDATITKTTLTIRHPLRGGQLKVLRGYIDDQGVIRLYDNEVGVTVELNWQPGNEFNPVVM